MNRYLSIFFAFAVLTISPAAFGQQLSSGEQELVNLINASRAQASLQPLTPDIGLSKVARSHSSDMAHRWFFSHTSPITGDVHARLRAAKVSYTAASESIAYVRSPSAAHNSIMGCELNRTNVLSPHFTHVGIGMVRVGRQIMVTENFITAPAQSSPARPIPLFSRPLWGPSAPAQAIPSSRSAVTPTPATTAQTAPPRAQTQRSGLASRFRRPQETRQCSVEGTWQGIVPNGMLRGRTVNLVFRADGTATGTSGSITLNTRWVRQGDFMSITDTSAHPNMAACPPNQTGQYTLSFSNDCRSVHVVNGNDVCSHRNQTLQGLQASRVR